MTRPRVLEAFVRLPADKREEALRRACAECPDKDWCKAKTPWTYGNPRSCGQKLFDRLVMEATRAMSEERQEATSNDAIGDEPTVVQVWVQTTVPAEIVIECSEAQACFGACLLAVDHGPRCSARNQKHTWVISDDPDKIREVY